MKLSQLKQGYVFVAIKGKYGQIFKLLEDPDPKKKTARCKNIVTPRIAHLTKPLTLEVELKAL
jgi:hypothetical protein